MSAKFEVKKLEERIAPSLLGILGSLTSHSDASASSSTSTSVDGGAHASTALHVGANVAGIGANVEISGVANLVSDVTASLSSLLNLGL